MDTNVGFARANNAGFRQTHSELVLLLNSDTVVPPGAVDDLVGRLRALPGAAVVGPRLIDRRGAAELSFGGMIGPLTELRQKLLTRHHNQQRVEELTTQPREVDWVSGACLLVRRDAADAAGLLDERYFMYCEDVDFCAAIRRRGGRVYFSPAVEVIHLRGRSGEVNRSATASAYRRSHLAFYWKHHPVWAPFLWLYLAVRGKLPGPSLADNQ
jgi:GT2 family glycosyltransferase